MQPLDPNIPKQRDSGMDELLEAFLPFFLASIYGYTLELTVP